MGEAENELRDVPRRIARERVPTIALSRDSLVFPYVDAHVQRRARGSASQPYAGRSRIGPSGGAQPRIESSLTTD